MAGAWTTLSVKDGGGTSRTMRVWDESGSGAGPFSFGQLLADGSGSAALSLGAGATAANTLRLALASDSPGVTTLGRTDANHSLPVVATLATVGTQTIVAGSASDGTILASNIARLGATVYNDSTAILYLLMAGATSSSTVYSVQLGPNAYYEVPANYTGVLKGIWASATGNARVTELTP